MLRRARRTEEHARVQAVEQAGEWIDAPTDCVDRHESLTPQARRARDKS